MDQSHPQFVHASLSALDNQDKSLFSFEDECMEDPFLFNWETEPADERLSLQVPPPNVN